MRRFSVIFALLFLVGLPSITYGHDVRLERVRQCQKYLVDERFNKNAAAYARQQEDWINLQWFAQKARDARMDFELCLLGVPLKDF